MSVDEVTGQLVGLRRLGSIYRQGALGRVTAELDLTMARTGVRDVAGIMPALLRAALP
jgi:hypothetical protein